MLPVKLVTFDVTGTLLFFRTPTFDKYLEVGLKFGIKADSDILRHNFQKYWKTLNEEHPSFGKQTGLHWRKWWECYVDKTYAGYIKPEEKHKISAILDYLIDFYTSKNAFTVRPGTDDLLQYLKTKSYRLGIISNYDPRLHKILELMDVKKYFDFVLLSYEFGYSKPDSRIFEEALRLGRCSSGQEALHVGNDLQLDYLGAKKAGLRAVLISSDEKDFNNIEVKRNEVFEDFSKLKSFFLRDV